MATVPVSPGLADVITAVTSMYTMNSQLTTTTILRMRNDMPRPTRATPFGITDLGQRQDLFRRFVATCSKYELGTPNAVALCLFLVLPVDRLEHYVRSASDHNFATAVYDWFCATAYTGLKVFLAKQPIGSITGIRGPSTTTSSVGAQTVAHQAAVLVSSPLAQPPTNISPSPEPAQTVRKRKTRDTSWDGPSARTRLRTRDAESTSRLPPLPAPVLTSPPPARTNIAAPTTPPRTAFLPVASPSTPPSLIAAIPPGSPFAPPSPTPSFLQRSHTAVTAARARDNGRCILTNHPLVQAAHIYPFSATKLAYHAATRATIQATTAHAAIGTLLGLWGDNLRGTWHTACNNRAVSETAQNLLCLDHYMHALWGHAYFGLEPLAQRDATTADGTGAEIDICFHWLSRGTRRPRDPVDNADDATLAAVCGRPDDRPLAPVAHRCSGVPLETGQVFTVRASNASELPSFALLEVQWHLTRLAAMSGAADVDDDDDDDDSAGGDLGVCTSQEDVRNWLYDTDVVPLDLNAAEPTTGGTEHSGP